MKPYRRKINYYETDQMQIVHHSNYARFLEETRLDMMEQMGLSYARLEHLGIIIPVLELHCFYSHALHFGETVLIYPHVYRLTPARFCLRY
ncbi:MAG: acyl-CoA thioesterase, partial [Eubacterium sp.]|nr:acyl-CoA thioesterase [Eubacterium sp.]